MLSQKVEDDPAPLDFIAPNGYYVVGDKNYNYKINALEAATQTGQDVRWHFNDEEFKNLNWKESNGIPLLELYRQRAQQLREKYDYLVLSYSGGSDTHTILESFINNNIKLDEIVCEWPLKNTSQFAVSASVDAENMVSEWALNIKPKLEQLRITNPDIKITILDALEDLSVEDFEDTCTITLRHAYVSVKRYRKISNYFQTVNEKHQNSALIMGFEKPHIFVKYNVLCAVFIDDSCWYKSSCRDYVKKIEYFFWSADMPTIVREQCHVLYNYLKINPHLISLFDSDTVKPCHGYVHYKFKMDLIKNLIYTNWHVGNFQVNKGNSMIYNEQHQWALDSSSVATQSWESSIRARISLIDKKYLTYFPNSDRLYQYKLLTTRAYPIGIFR
jgi:hypothetical protein